jgi:hypothetical protein
MFRSTRNFVFLQRACIALLVLALFGQAQVKYTLTGVGELGFLGVAGHRIQFSKDGTYFNYPRDGGQDILFPFTRLSLDLALGPRHKLVFLYQPLSLVTREVLTRDLVVDGTVFSSGAPMRFTYNFPFWRASWLYDFAKDPKTELAFGISLQIRNATIEFESIDGAQLRSTRDIGPVPVLKTSLRREAVSGVWLGLEADGFYAPVSYINGSDEEVIGAILDVAGRVGLKHKTGQSFLGLRYLGGGAVGTSSDRKGPGDGYVRNWLHFFTLSLGFRYPLFF